MSSNPRSSAAGAPPSFIGSKIFLALVTIGLGIRGYYKAAAVSGVLLVFTSIICGEPSARKRRSGGSSSSGSANDSSRPSNSSIPAAELDQMVSKVQAVLPKSPTRLIKKDLGKGSRALHVNVGAGRTRRIDTHNMRSNVGRTLGIFKT